MHAQLGPGYGQYWNFDVMTIVKQNITIITIIVLAWKLPTDASICPSLYLNVARTNHTFNILQNIKSMILNIFHNMSFRDDGLCPLAQDA